MASSVTAARRGSGRGGALGRLRRDRGRGPRGGGGAARHGAAARCAVPRTQLPRHSQARDRAQCELPRQRAARGAAGAGVAVGRALLGDRRLGGAASSGLLGTGVAGECGRYRFRRCAGLPHRGHRDRCDPALCRGGARRALVHQRAEDRGSGEAGDRAQGRAAYEGLGGGQHPYRGADRLGPGVRRRAGAGGRCEGGELSGSSSPPPRSSRRGGARAGTGSAS